MTADPRAISLGGQVSAATRYVELRPYIAEQATVLRAAEHRIVFAARIANDNGVPWAVIARDCGLHPEELRRLRERYPVVREVPGQLKMEIEGA